jgi:hypothetical protein
MARRSFTRQLANGPMRLIFIGVDGLLGAAQPGSRRPRSEIAS